MKLFQIGGFHGYVSSDYNHMVYVTMYSYGGYQDFGTNMLDEGVTISGFYFEDVQF
jgi:hypothetical protein